MKTASPSPFSLLRLAIRPGVVGDLDRMYDLDCLCFARPFHFSRRTMAGFAHSPTARTLVAEDAGAMLGFAIVEHTGGQAYLVTLDVHPAVRRQGIARLLMTEAELGARLAGADTLMLHVSAQNTAARSFYQQVGFAQCGLAPDYYGPGLDGMELRKVLKGREEVRS